MTAMAEDGLNLIPSRDEPDPENIRQRSFQGGTDGVPDGFATTDQTYGMLKYEDGETGPFANLKAVNGASSGLSGLPEADAGVAPAQFSNPEAPREIGGGERPRTGP